MNMIELRRGVEFWMEQAITAKPTLTDERWTALIDGAVGSIARLVEDPHAAA
jgi:hypothetical protein